MEALPPEILHAICTYLTPDDAASARLVSRKLAGIAVYHVVKSAHFHSSWESIQRLKRLSEHSIFKQTIKTVTYEGSVVANVGCVHAYNRHFADEPHHAHDRPQAPPTNVSPREARLYQRNKTKFQREVNRSYEMYRSLYDAQQDLFNNPLFGTLLGQSMSRFTQLTSIEYLTSRRCLHLASSRFNGEFGGTCTVPMTADPLHSVTQVRPLIVPDELVSRSLRSLQLENLSPTFFSGCIPSESIVACFSNLTNLTLIMKLASDDVKEDDSGPDASLKRILSIKSLSRALSAASKLQYLHVGVASVGAQEVILSDLFEEDALWPDLTTMILLRVSGTQIGLVTMLKRQPQLECVTLLSPILTTGKWVDTISQMREELDLVAFSLEEEITDSTGSQAVELVNEALYAEDFQEFTLAEAIDLYVTSVDDDEYTVNPLEKPERYANQEYLYESYGYSPSELYDSEDSMLYEGSDHYINDDSQDDDDNSNILMTDLEDIASQDEMHE